MLQEVNMEFLKREIGGEKEVYIHGYIDKYEIWIYLNGTEIQGKDIILSFEQIDYDTEEELINDFIKNIKNLLSSAS